MLNRADQLRDKLVKSCFDAWGLAFFVVFFHQMWLYLDRAGQSCEVNTDCFQGNLKLNDTKVGVATLIDDLDIGDESL